jgi:hypothetical protein
VRGDDCRDEKGICVDAVNKAAAQSAVSLFGGIAICFNAASSILAGGCAYGVAAYLLRRDHPRLKWSGIALIGITAMQWVEGALWLNGPTPHGIVNQILTVVLIPLALLAQPWRPLLGSAFDRPLRGRRWAFFALLLLGLATVVIARIVYQPTHTQVTSHGHLNWWSPRNPPQFPLWAYSFWGLLIGTPFLLWWRPLWQSLLIVSWGWIFAAIGYAFTDSAASYWCFYVSFYAVFVLVYAMMVNDRRRHPMVTVSAADQTQQNRL